MVKSARKRITDMHYEERLTCIVKYYAKHLGEKITKTQARQRTLTREQYCGGIDPLYPHGYTWAAPPEVAQPAR